MRTIARKQASVRARRVTHIAITEELPPPPGWNSRSGVWNTMRPNRPNTGRTAAVARSFSQVQGLSLLRRLVIGAQKPPPPPAVAVGVTGVANVMVTSGRRAAPGSTSSEPGVGLAAGHLDETTGARHGTWSGASESEVTGANIAGAVSEA